MLINSMYSGFGDEPSFKGGGLVTPQNMVKCFHVLYNMQKVSYSLYNPSMRIIVTRLITTRVCTKLLCEK
ncbi:hypothetical protein HanIR_Chr01g0003871 [Helianthus annuus]|nr:hypothetical protein HanIR_Chr01g0003871 [Helianthus annuus]